MDCGSKCRLRDGCKSGPIPMEEGEGWPRVLVVGEAPGEDEDRLCKPFIGKSGQLLRMLMDEVLPPKVRPWITNAVRCRPPQNALPQEEERKACRVYLLEDIRKAKPDFIMAFGATALKSVLSMVGITKVRGQRFELAEEGFPPIPVYPIFHPAYVLRNPTVEGLWEQDARRAVDSFINPKKMDSLPYTLVDQEEFCAMARRNGAFTFDVETTSLDPFGLGGKETHLLVLGLATRSPKGKLVVYQWWPKEGEPLAPLVALFGEKKVLKTAHNLKFDALWLKVALGIVVAPPIFCTMTAYHIAVSEEMTSRLKTLAYQFTEWGGYEKKLMGLVNQKKSAEAKDESHFTDVTPKEELGAYNAMDCVVTLVLLEKLKPLVDADEGFSNEYYNVLMPNLPVLIRVEERGVVVDLPEWKRLSRLVRRKMMELHLSAWKALLRAGIEDYDIWYTISDRVEAYEAVPKDSERKFLSLSSRHHLLDILYTKLKLPVTIKTPKGAPSVGEDALELLFNRPEAKVEFVKLLSQWRLFDTINKMFLKPLPSLLDGEGRIHPKYSQTRTVTGRLASEGPNFQQLPKPPKPGSPLEGINIRSLFVSGFPNGKIIQADFSQIELRKAALYAGDKLMLKWFREGKDVHKYAASLLYKKPVESIAKDSEERDRAKVVNFGIIYGKTAKGFSEEFGISLQESEAFLDDYFKTFEGIYRWTREVARRVKQTGLVRSEFGRLRRLGGAQQDDRGVIAAAIRQAVNFNPQASASDMTQQAMVRIDARFTEMELQAYICGTVHDSIITDSPEEEVETVERVMKGEMERWDYSIPIVADISKGDCWGEVK